MSKKSSTRRHPKTQNEKRQNQDGWCRAKRRPAHLVDIWDDKEKQSQRSWKKLRKTQYYVNGRGEKHKIYIDNSDSLLHSCVSFWDLEQYFKKHSIPYNIEEVTEKYTKHFLIYKKEIVGEKPLWHTKFSKISKENYNEKKIHQIGWGYIYEWKIIGYKKKIVAKTIGYILTWWSNKDIGIKYLLKEKIRMYGYKKKDIKFFYV